MDFTEITNISLVANRRDIELTRRTWGYATRRTQKGYFHSNIYGSVLIFMKTHSSPTIHIQRWDKPDVFLNFRDNEATKTLYAEMKIAFEK
jgi:hypothetical protein